MAGVIRSTIAAGALMISPGAPAFSQVNAETAPGVIVAFGDKHQARRSEETEVAGGLTLDEIMAMLALDSTVAVKKNSLGKRFELPPYRIGGVGTHVGYSAVRRIIQPNRYTNWSTSPKSLPGRTTQ